jgi:hypothetical protein
MSYKTGKISPQICDNLKSQKLFMAKTSLKNLKFNHFIQEFDFRVD